MASIRFPSIPPRLKRAMQTFGTFLGTFGTFLGTFGTFLGTFFILILGALCSPLVLLNYAIAKLAVAIIKHKKFNIFKLKIETLQKIMSLIIYTEIIILSLATFIMLGVALGISMGTAMMALGVNPVFGVIVRFMVTYAVCWIVSVPIIKFICSIMFRPLQMIDAELHPAQFDAAELTQQIRQLGIPVENAPEIQVENAPEIQLENDAEIPDYDAALDRAINNLEIDELLNLLIKYATTSPWRRFYWSASFDTKFENINLNKIGIWSELEPSILQYLVSKYENSDLYCNYNYFLKQIPIIMRVGERNHKEDLLTILKLQFQYRGIIRDKSSNPIEYKDITFDSDTATLIKSIIAKAQDMQTELFKSTLDTAIATNNFKNMLKHLQHLETKHDLSLGALYWNSELEGAYNKFRATALDARQDNKQYPREHCCSITLKVMQNPCYIIDPQDPSKRIYYEELELLKWISDHDNLPLEQSEAAPPPNNMPSQRVVPLLSQINYDDALKATLDATYNRLHSNYNRLHSNQALLFTAARLNDARQVATRMRQRVYARLI